ELVWVQEEPENMGAWTWLRPHLAALTASRWPLRLVARPANSSPAEGSSAVHAVTQQALVAHALDPTAVGDASCPLCKRS
ncbi:MAG TPA: hypothetical protein VMG58_17970, partial [Candidatus Sulfotelmatobacter sp.]|nr:hypothetical protein [Candidatus Sulfotelmatobacter sp.]